MSEEITASVQYGDMRGTISIDGWDGIVTTSFAGCPKGYWPVGLSLYAEPTERGGDLDPDVYVLAVDESILDGKGPDAVRKYAKQHGQLPVFRFQSKAKVQNILPKIKRLSIVLQDKATERVPLMLTGPDSIN